MRSIHTVMTSVYHRRSHQCQIHTTHQSDREYTRTSITHSSTTHSTNTKKAPLGGTYSAPSCPMMSYTANILLPIPKKTNPIPPSGYCTQGLGQYTCTRTPQFNHRANAHSLVGALCLIPRMSLLLGLEREGITHVCNLHYGTLLLTYSHIPLTYTPFKMFLINPWEGGGGGGV